MKPRSTAVVVALTTLVLVLLPLLKSGGDVAGVLRYLNHVAIQVVIFAVITIGLNIQLGYAGITNFGVAGFFLLGSYTAAIFVLPPSKSSFLTYVGGFGTSFNWAPALATDQWLPFLVGAAAAAAACGVLALLLSLVTPRLKDDYLAIATIGMAELLRALANVEVGIVNGDRGLLGIPAPLFASFTKDAYPVVFLVIAVCALILVYVFAERSVRSPWGRVLRAIREDEVASASVGKNVFKFRAQSFVIGACITGVAAAFFTYSQGALTPSYFEPLQGTFIFWVMLIVGGVGSNKGAALGAYVVWALWTVTLELASFSLPDFINGRLPYFRLMLLGVVFVAMLLLRPQGLIAEDQRVSRWLGRLSRQSSAAGADEVRP